MPIDPKTAQEAVDAKLTEINATDDDIMNIEVSVRQAIDELTKALEAVEQCLDKQRYEKASNLGYTPLASAFVFVQRTLAGLTSAEMDKVGIVQGLAQILNCAYEEVAPHVEAKMRSMQPRSPVTLEDAGEYLADMAKFRAQFGPDGEWLDNIDDDKDTAKVLPARDLARGLGFGRRGYQKAIALYQACQSRSQAQAMMSLPSATWERIERESARLGVPSEKLVEAAISSWLDTNPSNARVPVERE